MEYTGVKNEGRTRASYFLVRACTAYIEANDAPHHRQSRLGVSKYPVENNAERHYTISNVPENE